MPTINIRAKVPEDDCYLCDYSNGENCVLFNTYLSFNVALDHKMKRCQACRDAEVEE